MDNIKKYMPLIFIIVIPFIMIYFLFDSYSIRFLTTLGEKVQEALHRKIDGVESELEWQRIFKYVFIFGIGYKITSSRMKKREIKMIISKKEETDVFLFLWSLFRVIVVWGSLVGFSYWSDINTSSYLESSNVIMVSVLIGIGFKLYNFYEAVKKD
jgi:hypothetical protein